MLPFLCELFVSASDTLHTPTTFAGSFQEFSIPREKERPIARVRDPKLWQAWRERSRRFRNPCRRDGGECAPSPGSKPISASPGDRLNVPIDRQSPAPTTCRRSLARARNPPRVAARHRLTQPQRDRRSWHPPPTIPRSPRSRRCRSLLRGSHRGDSQPIFLAATIPER